eukprot:TRINITY_DN3501_c0_g4_i1.p1 TRINITY_DN3501_c0_g4~~TRINITY_DN3501_c0_g4_i1.p1  ORF type:complete len:119 (+),score=27.86 TRINITY_DN3501_c0_g4_i1:150-506(+)
MAERKVQAVVEVVEKPPIIVVDTQKGTHKQPRFSHLSSNLSDFLAQSYTRDKDYSLNKLEFDFARFSAVGLLAGGTISLFFFRRKIPFTMYSTGFAGGLILGAFWKGAYGIRLGSHAE